MSAIRWFSAALLACGALAACDALFGQELNAKFCAAHPDDVQCRVDASPSQGCSSSVECVAPLVCDVMGTQTCVACTLAEPAACTGTTPVCGGDHLCHGCASHAECLGSGVCLPDGSCADAGQVAYVEPAPGGSDNTRCTLTMPCTKVASALQAVRPYVKISGTNDEGGTITIDNRYVTLLGGSDAKLTRTSIGLHVEVKGTSEVQIQDLEISGALGAQGVGISMPTGNTAKLTLQRVKLTNNTGGGISANGGTLTINQSTISGNTGGGLSVTNAEFEIVNSLIVKNGSPSSSYGGVVLSQINTGTRRFEFNTIVQNQTTSGITPGVLCLAVGTMLTLTNAIVYDNGTGLQVEGPNCEWSYSDIGPMAVAGTGNLNSAPQFVNPAQADFHLQSGSPAKDAADLEASLAIDIDGDPRPQGAARDMGADEIR